MLKRIFNVNSLKGSFYQAMYREKFKEQPDTHASKQIKSILEFSLLFYRCNCLIYSINNVVFCVFVYLEVKKHGRQALNKANICRVPIFMTHKQP